MGDEYPRQPPISTGLAGRCPRCGEGKLFSGFIAVAPRCSACELDFSFADSADGPAVFIMLIGGFLIAGFAVWLEVTYEPAIWVHLATTLPIALVVSLGLLRPFKGVMIALQYVHKAEEGRRKS